MRGVLAVACVVGMLIPSYVIPKEKERDLGVMFSEIVLIPDVDGDGILDSISVRSLSKKAQGQDNAWVRNYLNNCGMPYWNSLVVLKGESQQNVPLFNTPVYWCAKKPIDTIGITIDGKFAMRDDSYRTFNSIVFTPEQVKWIMEKNGWIKSKPNERL